MRAVAMGCCLKLIGVELAGEYSALFCALIAAAGCRNPVGGRGGRKYWGTSSIDDINLKVYNM